MKLTKDFRSEEFECGCGCQTIGAAMQVEFMLMLQRMRDTYGKPIKINSGWRCKDHNKAIGGSPTSYHLRGRAVDIRCVSSADRYLLKRAAILTGFTGIGTADTFIHIDNRDTEPMWWLY